MKWNPRELDPEWPFELTRTEFALEAESTALVVVDMQGNQMTIDPESPLALEYPHIVEYWNRRLDETAIPNIQRLIGWFRERNLKVVYTRNGNVTSTGDEMTGRLKGKFGKDGPSYHRNSPAYQIDERLAPHDEDLIVDKLTSGAFTGSILDHGLRNMGIRSIVLTGILTDACVFGTARAAAEIGYQTLICDDACAAFTQRAHNDALVMHARIFGRVENTDTVLEELAGK